MIQNSKLEEVATHFGFRTIDNPLKAISSLSLNFTHFDFKEVCLIPTTSISQSNLGSV
jgi:hypothetical protein